MIPRLSKNGVVNLVHAECRVPSPGFSLSGLSLAAGSHSRTNCIKNPANLSFPHGGLLPPRASKPKSTAKFGKGEESDPRPERFAVTGPSLASSECNLNHESIRLQRWSVLVARRPAFCPVPTCHQNGFVDPRLRLSQKLSLLRGRGSCGVPHIGPFRCTTAQQNAGKRT